MRKGRPPIQLPACDSLQREGHGAWETMKRISCGPRLEAYPQASLGLSALKCLFGWETARLAIALVALKDIMAPDRTVYSPHPGFAMEASFASKLKEKTGKALDDWIAILKKSGPPTEKEQRSWLKEKHGFTTNYAQFVAARAAGHGGKEGYDPDGLVNAMFSGPKAALRSLYEELLAFGTSLGPDVKVCPCQTIVPFYRKHVFAQLKPSTRSRIDLGLALRDLKPTGPLIDTGGFAKKDRITHRIEISSPRDFNDEAKRWWKKAYETNE